MESKPNELAISTNTEHMCSFESQFEISNMSSQEFCDIALRRTGLKEVESLKGIFVFVVVPSPLLSPERKLDRTLSKRPIINTLR